MTLPGKGTMLDGDANWAPQAHERMESPARADLQRPPEAYPQLPLRNHMFRDACVRCLTLWPDLVRRNRLVETRDSLLAPITEVEREDALRGERTARDA